MSGTMYGYTTRSRLFLVTIRYVKIMGWDLLPNSIFVFSCTKMITQGEEKRKTRNVVDFFSTGAEEAPKLYSFRVMAETF